MEMIVAPDNCDVEPGEEEFEDSLFPGHIVTPYCHSWVNHVPEMFENARDLSRYFQSDDRMSGGLAFARTDSLERSNLAFFHCYFQTMSRRPKEICKAAGMKSLRQVFNPEKTSRAKFACQHCGRPYTYKKRYDDHIDACVARRRRHMQHSSTTRGDKDSKGSEDSC